uniref:Uncharacterized protein n=1 Tax=Eutreptiella gymnastica TaxID=73025 RepID=A0A7S1NW02_9EUGL|mmetsp:Transcript_91694/g.159008  ORF Transcript_91694/g.159008 Transcript_91694/m.159008 type:complete len:135 (+) Transcript_91694:61-465(+)
MHYVQYASLFNLFNRYSQSRYSTYAGYLSSRKIWPCGWHYWCGVQSLGYKFSSVTQQQLHVRPKDTHKTALIFFAGFLLAKFGVIQAGFFGGGAQGPQQAALRLIGACSSAAHWTGVTAKGRQDDIEQKEGPRP